MKEDNAVFVWWCGGVEDEGDGPEIVWPRNQRQEPDVGSPAYGHGFIYNAYVVCGTCNRLAPDQNGCRWVTREEVQRLQDSE